MTLIQRLLARFKKAVTPGLALPPNAFPPPSCPDLDPLPTDDAVPVREGRVLCASPAGLHHMHYLDWGDENNPRIALCVHGLTRSSRDFDGLARALAKTHRVICPDVVGRGQSDWLRDKALYAVPQYVADMVTLIARLGVKEVDWVGTSMGGLIGMSLGALEGAPIRRMVLNDVGPLLSHSALNRIGTYVGRPFHFADLIEAEAHVRKVHAPFGPHSDDEWQHMTRHCLRPDGDGYTFHYDPGIAEAFRIGPILMDVNLWPLYEQLRCPVLALRGGDSDLITAQTLAQMAQRGPRAEIIEFAGVGHAPTLMHDDQIQPVLAFLNPENHSPNPG